MTSYRRFQTTGASYFFTVSLAQPGSAILIDNIDQLRRAYALTRAERPFQCDAMVVLPDHLHAVWTLPAGDADFSTRWRLIKARFTREIAGVAPRSRSKREKGERGVWQRRFWEHCIRDADDFARHVGYCWGNPVRHGYTDRAVDWPFSSIHRDVRLGRVNRDWVSADLDFGEMGEPGAGPRNHPSYGFG